MRIEENQGSKGPHPDYERNLEMAKRFATNVEKNSVDGLSIKVSDFVMTISFFPPHSSKLGIQAYPINLHQPNIDFSREMEKTYSFYFNGAKKFWAERDPKQLSIPLPESAQKTSSVAEDALMWWDK